MLDPINVKYWKLVHKSEDLGVLKTDDFPCRCDICGDSARSQSKKRLHLYRKQSYDSDSIKCFNCGYTGTMYSYLKNFHPSFYNSYVQECNSNKIQNIISIKPKMTITKPQNTLYLFDAPPEFVSIFDVPEALEYCKKRCIEPQSSWMYCKNSVKLQDKLIFLKDYIIIPLLKNGKWYGFYSRSIHHKNFYTYIPEQNTGYKVYNYYNVNLHDTVYVFEGIFDALSSGLENVVACLGSDIPEKLLSTFKQVVFCFDNDAVGREKSLKYANLGYKVFIFDKDCEYKDINEMKMANIDTKAYIQQRIYEGIMAQVKLRIL